MVAYDYSGHQAPMLPHAEEDVGTIPDWIGFCIIRFEARDRFPSDHIILVVHGEDNIGDVMKILYGFIV